MVLSIVKSNSVHSVARQTFLCEAERRISIHSIHFMRGAETFWTAYQIRNFQKKIFSKFCKDTQISQDDITITCIQTTI